MLLCVSGRIHYSQQIVSVNQCGPCRTAPWKHTHKIHELVDWSLVLSFLRLMLQNHVPWLPFHLNDNKRVTTYAPRRHHVVTLCLLGNGNSVGTLWDPGWWWLALEAFDSTDARNLILNILMPCAFAMCRFIQPFRVTHKKQVYTIQLVELQQ